MITRQERHRRVRGKISGTKERPRLCVFRSAKHIYAQLIDDEKNVILFSADDRDLKGKPVEKAFEVGKIIGKKAKEAVFDKAGYRYHGRVKAVAEGAREAGLKI
jgi:large subunit ribosomal protein L18